MLFEPYVIPGGKEKIVDLVPAPGLTAPKEVLQLVDLAALAARFVSFGFVPEVGDGIAHIVAVVIMPEAFVGNVPSEALEKVGRNGRGGLLPVVRHLDAQ